MTMKGGDAMKRLVTSGIVCLLVLMASPALAATGLGDFPVAATVYCPWTTNAQTGASITRGTNGTVSVYHSANLTQSTTGVTDGEDHDSLTGVHMVTIDTSADGTFYAAGREFSVVLSAATIDTLTVNSVLCTFSLERTGGTLALIKARTPNAAAGASGGLFISGTNTGTVTITNGLVVARSGAGSAISVTSTNGDGINIAPTAGSGIVSAANGTSKHGAIFTGGTAGTSDGLKLVAGTGGVDMRANITGSLSGSVGSVASLSGGARVMPTDALVKGSTSVVYTMMIIDSATGEGMTGLTSASSGLKMRYCRVDQGNADCADITPAASTRGSYTSGGFVEKDATDAPGLYEVGLPTVSVATGADLVYFYLSGVSGMSATIQPIALVDTGLAAINTKLGTPAGASMSADIASEATKTTAIKAKTDSLGFTGANVNAQVAAYTSGQAPLQPTVAGRTLDVTTTGAAGIDWANIENPTTAVNLSGTNIDVDQVTASVSGAVGSVTGAVGSVTGSVGSVVGAVGSVAGAVGSVTGAVGSVTAVSAGAITAASFGAGAIDATSIHATGADKIGDDVIARFPANIASLLISSGGINTAGGTYRNNVAGQVYPVYMVDSSGDAVTGATVAVKVSKDGGAGVSITGTVAQIDATNVPGWYLISFSQSDTACTKVCAFKATAAGTVPRAFYFTTAP